MPEQEPIPQNEIAILNDLFRMTFQGGRVLMTPGIQALPDTVRHDVFAQVMSFDDFNEDNDPYGEHDFGMIEMVDAGTIYWKIDYLRHQCAVWQRKPCRPLPNDAGADHYAFPRILDGRMCFLS